MRLAIGVEVGQSVEALVVLREAAKAEEESADAHLHQQVVLLCPARRQALGHLWKLLRQRWLELALALAGWGGRGGLYVLLIEGIDQVWGDCGGGG